jgi:RES domain
VPLTLPPLDLDGFPTHAIGPSTLLFRIHGRRRSPWWYSQDGSGRFDLVSFGNHGTCYLAEREMGSFVEIFRDAVPIAMPAIEERCTSEFSFPNELVVADCTSRAARGFGITAELHSGRDYSRPQAWALALASEGFDGIRYFVSHDPAQDLVGIALFGSVGDVPSRSEARDIDREVLANAEQQFGLRVLSTASGN